VETANNCVSLVSTNFSTCRLKSHFLYCRDQIINGVHGTITVSYKNCMELVHKLKGKAIPLQAWTGPEGSRGWGSQISRQSAHAGGKVVRPTHRPPLPPGSIPGTHSCYRLSQTQGHSAAGSFMSMRNSIDTIGNRTHSLSAFSAMP
jgi:hypothetical protein